MIPKSDALCNRPGLNKNFGKTARPPKGLVLTLGRVKGSHTQRGFVKLHVIMNRRMAFYASHVVGC